MKTILKTTPKGSIISIHSTQRLLKIFSLFFITCLSACSITDNALDKLNKKVPELSQTAVKNVTTELTTDSTKLKLEKFAGLLAKSLTDSLISNLGKDQLSKIGVDTLSEIIGKTIMESINTGLNDSLLQSKMDTLFSSISKNGQQPLSDILRSLSHTDNKQAINQFLSGLLTREIFDASLNVGLKEVTKGILDSAITNVRIEELKNQLLGQNTRDSLNLMLDSAMSIIINRINKDLKVEEQLSFFQKWLTELLISAGLVACGVIGFFWYQKRKSARIAQLVLTQINEMPNQEAYDELTNRIQKVTRNQDLETSIRQILKNNGMLGQEDWARQVKKQKRVT